MRTMSNFRKALPILSLILSLQMGNQLPGSPSLAASPQQSAPIVLTGQVDTFDIIDADVQEMIGIKCTKTPSAVHVSKVRAGSEAAKKGLKAGDAILDVWRDGKNFNLSVRRDSSTFVVKLSDHAQPAHLQKETAKIDLASVPVNKLQATQNRPFSLEASKVGVLANYQVELLLDRSLSMRKRDCPGGLSRWDWCSYQAVGVAQAIEPYVPAGLTITRFATEFDVHEHSTVNDVVGVLSQHDFQLGTCLCEPLLDRLQAYMNNHKRGDKPLLIGVITDGVPWPQPEPRMVRKLLVNASNTFQPGQVTVVFFQIGGDDPRGRDYLMELGNNLTEYGARYQLAKTVPFEQLQEEGLANAMVAAVQSSATPRRIGMYSRRDSREFDEDQ